MPAITGTSSTRDSRARPSARSRSPQPGQVGMFGADVPPLHPALTALRALEVDNLSPIEALTKLYDLKRLAGEES